MPNDKHVPNDKGIQKAKHAPNDKDMPKEKHAPKGKIFILATGFRRLSSILEQRSSLSDEIFQTTCQNFLKLLHYYEFRSLSHAQQSQVCS
jgi:hypothetical protein